MQFQLATLSPDLVHQLANVGEVCTHGGAGMNIPCDFHNEHVNKLFKEVVSNMGANFTEVASTRAVRAVTSLAHMSERFDTQSGIHPEASAHTTKSDDVDVMTVVRVLQERDVLSVHSGRSHQSSPRCPPIH